MRVTLSRAVPSSSVILRFDDYLRVEFTGYNEVRCLIEPFDTFCPFGFTETDPRPGENFLNRGLKAVADEFTYGVLDARQKAFQEIARRAAWP